MLNKGYALIDVLTTPTCMVMVASTSATNPGTRLANVLQKHTWSGSGGSYMYMYEIERTKLKISMMTSTGDSISATQHPIVLCTP